MRLAASCDLLGVPVDYDRLFVTGEPVYLTILVARYERAAEIAAEMAEGR